MLRLAAKAARLGFSVCVTEFFWKAYLSIKPALTAHVLAAAPSVRGIQPAHETTSINVTINVAALKFNKLKFRVKFKFAVSVA